MIVSRHPRRSASPCTAHFLRRPIAHPPLTPLQSALPDKHRVLLVFTRNRPPLSPLEATLTRMLTSVDSKWFMGKLSPLDATFTKNPGWPALAPSAGIKMNLARTGSCLVSDTLGHLHLHLTQREASLRPRFASRPYNCLVDYIDPLLQRVGPGEHFSHPTQGPRSLV